MSGVPAASVELSTDWKRTAPAIKYRLAQAFAGSEEHCNLPRLLRHGNCILVPGSEPHIFIYACSGLAVDFTSPRRETF
jgi:hypothetical protein